MAITQYWILLSNDFHIAPAPARGSAGPACRSRRLGGGIPRRLDGRRRRFFAPDLNPDLNIVCGRAAGNWRGGNPIGVGILYFVGRLDEMIKTGGFRVSPTEVESSLYATGLVGEAVAFGAPHRTLGQGIVVVATPARGGRLDQERLLEVCRETLPTYLIPRLVVERSSLARNANGKIDRKTLATEFADAFQDVDDS